jgi:beta-lactamase regulating signal transducer with metallopeptidase domain
MTDHSPLSAVSMWITFFVQIACGYLLTRILSALCRSHQVRLRLWTSFLLLTASGWIFVSVPRPVAGSVATPTAAVQETMATHWSWPLSNSWIQALDRLGIWAAWIYGVALAVLLLQLLAQRLRLDLLLRNREDASPELRSLFGALCRDLGVRHCRVSLLAELRSPATVGWFRPYVLLPTELVPRLDSDQLVQILRHELIHVRRRDYLWDRLAAFGCRILFFHPAAWLAYRRIRWERELACDQAVVENNWDSRLPYAECLTGLARWWFISDKSSPKGIGFSSSSSLLATRIRELLREPRRASIFERGLRTGFIVTMFAAGVVFLPSIALTLYRSGSILGPPHLGGMTLNSPPRARVVRKDSPREIRLDVPLQSPAVPPTAEVQDPTVRMLISSGSTIIPILRTAPAGTSSEALDKTASGKSERGQRAESADSRGAWDESSEPQAGVASTTLHRAAIDAINIGLANAGGGQESTGGSDGSGGEQGNHLQ